MYCTLGIVINRSAFELMPTQTNLYWLPTSLISMINPGRPPNFHGPSATGISSEYHAVHSRPPENAFCTAAFISEDFFGIFCQCPFLLWYILFIDKPVVGNLIGCSELSGRIVFIDRKKFHLLYNEPDYPVCHLLWRNAAKNRPAWHGNW